LDEEPQCSSLDRGSPAPSPFDLVEEDSDEDILRERSSVPRPTPTEPTSPGGSDCSEESKMWYRYRKQHTDKLFTNAFGWFTTGHFLQDSATLMLSTFIAVLTGFGVMDEGAYWNFSVLSCWFGLLCVSFGGALVVFYRMSYDVTMLPGRGSTVQCIRSVRNNTEHCFPSEAPVLREPVCETAKPPIDSPTEWRQRLGGDVWREALKVFKESSDSDPKILKDIVNFSAEEELVCFEDAPHINRTSGNLKLFHPSGHV